MKFIKINGHKVVFGKVCNSAAPASSCGMEFYYDKVQRWDIPTLDLYGYVRVKSYKGNVVPLNDIIQSIQNTVDFDLGERRKKSLGIYQ